MTLRQNVKGSVIPTILGGGLALSLVLSACSALEPAADHGPLFLSFPTATTSPQEGSERPEYSPGELVDYTAQTGDTLANLAVHFNTTVEEILRENPIIPADATTLPPGLPMSIPIYYEPLWGTQFQILPNCAFVNGPAQIGFDINAFVDSQPGWFKDYRQYAAEKTRTGAEIISYVANTFSVSPRLLLALLEYQLGALSDPQMPEGLVEGYPLGYEKTGYHGLYIQLVWAANTFNRGYYGWLTGHLDTLEFLDQTIAHPDPWQTAATVSLQYYFSKLEPKPGFDETVGPEGFIRTYRALFGDPWSCEPHIPGSLHQPTMQLPFEAGKTWAFTGGPHTGWGQGDPLAALDFAPPSAEGGCEIVSEWAVAVAPGVVARTDTGLIELDLDGDGDPRTGWVVLYLHLGSQHKARLGDVVDAGDPLGHPSCEGGESTGSHIHIARKYNGEWIPAAGTLPFNLDGWIAHAGAAEYLGSLTRYTETVIASVEAEEKSLIRAPRSSP
jgi:LasA protease